MRAYEFTTPLRTERLTLRLMTMDDVDAIHAYHSLPDVTRYMLFDARDRDAVIATSHPRRVGFEEHLHDAEIQATPSSASLTVVVPR